MDYSTKKFICDKWEIILKEYEKVKKKESKIFKSVQALCNAHQVSRKQVLKYHKKWLFGGKNREALLPNPRGPKKGQYRLLSKEEERTIVKIQRKFIAKPMDIWCMVQGKFDVHPSAKTISRILNRYPLRKKKQIIHRYEKKIPGELIHGDTYHIPKDVFVDKKERYLQGYIDDCTRMVYVEMISRKKALNVARVTMRMGKWFSVHGVFVERIMTDNGPEYTVASKPGSNGKHVFEMLLNISGVIHVYIKPYRPQTNGKIERFWRILKDEFIAGLENLTEKEFIRKLKLFMYYYNYQRLHGSLFYQSPFQKLKSVTETLG